MTRAGEYGFAGSNPVSLIHIRAFDDVRLIGLQDGHLTLKQKPGNLLRRPILEEAGFVKVAGTPSPTPGPYQAFVGGNPSYR